MLHHGLTLIGRHRIRLRTVPRVRIPPSLRRIIETRSAGVCCVCRRIDVGTNIHHIDHDPSNNKSENLALICIQDHDAHHRPKAYHLCHRLSADELRRHKSEWEDFVAKARSDPPRVLATVNSFGSADSLHAVRLVMQDETGRIGFEQDFHFLDAPMDSAIDEVFRRIVWLNPKIILYGIHDPKPIEYCDCKHSLSETYLPAFTARELAPDWSTKSVLSIFSYVDQPWCDMCLTYGREEPELEWFLHRCGNSLSLREIQHGATNPARTEEYPIMKRPSVRTQVTYIVAGIIDSWKPGRCLIGTGNPDRPTLIEDLTLPRCWEHETRRAKWLKRRSRPSHSPKAAQ